MAAPTDKYHHGTADLRAVVVRHGCVSRLHGVLFEERGRREGYYACYAPHARSELARRRALYRLETRVTRGPLPETSRGCDGSVDDFFRIRSLVLALQKQIPNLGAVDAGDLGAHSTRRVHWDHFQRTNRSEAATCYFGVGARRWRDPFRISCARYCSPARRAKDMALQHSLRTSYIRASVIRGVRSPRDTCESVAERRS